MDEAPAIRAQKEPAREACRNKYALDALRDQKFQIDVAIRTLRRLANVLTQIEQHSADSAPDPVA